MSTLLNKIILGIICFFCTLCCLPLFIISYQQYKIHQFCKDEKKLTRDWKSGRELQAQQKNLPYQHIDNSSVINQIMQLNAQMQGQLLLIKPDNNSIKIELTLPRFGGLYLLHGLINQFYIQNLHRLQINNTGAHETLSATMEVYHY